MRAKAGSYTAKTELGPRAHGESSLLGGQPLEAYMPLSVRPRPNPYPDAHPQAPPVTADEQGAPDTPAVLQKPARAVLGPRAEGSAAAVDTRQAVPKAAAAAATEDPARDRVQGMIQVCCRV